MTRHYGDPALFTPARRRMARVPHGGVLVDNPVSVASGFQMENVFTFAGIPKVAEAMFQSMKHRLVGGTPVAQRTVRTNLPEGIIAFFRAAGRAVEALRGSRHRLLSGSSATASPASRWSCAARMAQGSPWRRLELMETIRGTNGEAEEL